MGIKGDKKKLRALPTLRFAPQCVYCSRHVGPQTNANPTSHTMLQKLQRFAPVMRLWGARFSFVSKVCCWDWRHSDTPSPRSARSFAPDCFVFWWFVLCKFEMCVVSSEQIYLECQGSGPLGPPLHDPPLLSLVTVRGDMLRVCLPRSADQGKQTRGESQAPSEGNCRFAAVRCGSDKVPGCLAFDSFFRQSRIALELHKWNRVGTVGPAYFHSQKSKTFPSI